MKKTIITIGMFDGVHRGHCQILQLLCDKAAQLSLTPAVVTFDRHPRQVLGAVVSDPSFGMLTTFDERVALIRRYGVEVVEVVPFTRELAMLRASQFYEDYLVPRLHPEALLLGFDNVFGNRQHNDLDLLRSRLAQSRIPVFDDAPLLYNDIEISSTKIRATLRDGDIPLANAMLGYDYSLSGLVVAGRKIGRTLGFPTANVAVADSGKVLPAQGVYHVTADTDGCCWQGVANLGPQPTVAGTGVVLEVHLLHFDGDLYGRTLRIAFHKYLRPIRKFASEAELSQQIRIDIAALS